MKHFWTGALVLLLAIGQFGCKQEEVNSGMIEKYKNSPNTIVKMETSQGDIYIELYADKAPQTVANFLAYTNEGFYKGTIFHRVINGFMIQGGGFTADMQQKRTKAPIKNEAQNGLKNEIGTIAMARTGIVDSATSQFFINVANNSFLDNRGSSASSFGYCVFGKVIAGMDVVEKIKGVPTTEKNGNRDVPVESIEIKDVTVIKK